jgi:glycosyltransferase involved in cell wall biosynthesis
MPDPARAAPDAQDAPRFDEPAEPVRATRLPHHLSVVVPMYNEVENAVPLVDAVQGALRDYPSPWELVVVDDGSRDGTAAALERRAAVLGPHVRVVKLRRNFGQSAAMQAGIDAARGDVIVTMDGDLQNDPADIPALVAKLLEDDKDLVAGWRSKRQDPMFLRKIPSKLGNRLIRRATRLEFHDLGCSLKAFRAGVLREIRLFGEMHRFIPAWLATVTSPERMAEVPVRHRGRERGASKYGISRTFRVVVDLLAVYFFLRFRARPGHFFGVLGLAVVAAGAAILAYLLGLKIAGESIGNRPLLLLGFFFVMGGVQLLTTGVLAEIVIRVYFDGRLAKAYHATERTPPPPEAGWHQATP